MFIGVALYAVTNIDAPLTCNAITIYNRLQRKKMKLSTILKMRWDGTAYSLAKSLRISSRTVYNWFNDKNKISSKMADKLKQLNVITEDDKIKLFLSGNIYG